MPFSRYQIRNEFSLADPELYKSADKDDPEALLEGVAMAGLVGVLRQLGDLAEFAAEIFHGLHEEVMVTAARGHSLLVRVQQVESDFPQIEQAFLSQTGHSAFFSSSGINWHPNMQMEQNLITKGDLPRFVMDSYEECRAPPRLFLLDKFDVAGAGACLKRYTDPSFYKVETSPYEMINIEAQRVKKIRKTKKKASRWKNGETPEVFQPSHVKLHQLLLEERVQNGASEPARRVKLKKREIKFPFDTETGNGYMEKLLNSPPEDKLVHEVKMVNSPPRLPTNYSSEPQFEPLEVKMINSTLMSPNESPIVDKTVSREHMDSISSIELQENGVDSEIEEIEEKHISVNTDHNNDVADDVASDVASEPDNYMDALATMESEVETETEIRPNSDQTVKQIQSQDSDSRSVSDDENSLNKKKINNFSYSDTASTSGDDMSSPRGVNSQFASTEIPFRPRVSPHQSFDAALLVDQETNFIENTSNESDLSEISKKKEEIEIDPEDIIDSSSSFVGNLECEVENEEENSNSTLLISHLEDEEITNDVLESNADVAEARVLYSSEDETELKDEVTVSVDSETKDDDRNIENNVSTIEEEKELKEKEFELLNSEIEDLIPVSVSDDVVSNESKNLFTCEETESVEKKEFSEESVISANYDHSNIQFLDNIYNNGNENDVDKWNESIESSEKKALSEDSVILPELDSIPSASYDHSNKQDLENDLNENDVENQSENLEILQDETVFVIEKTDQNAVNEQSNAEFLDNVPNSLMSADFQESESLKFDHQDVEESESLKKDEQIDKLTEKVDQTVDYESDPDTQESKSLKKDEQIDELEEKVDQIVDSESNPDIQESNSLKFIDQDVENFESLEKDEQIDELEEKVDQTVDFESNPDFQESKSLKFIDQDIEESKSLKKDEQIDELEEKVDQTVYSEPDPDFQESKSLKNDHIDELEERVDQNLDSEFDPVDHETVSLKQGEEFQDLVEPSMVDLSQLSNQINLSGFSMFPQLPQINTEEMPPLPPLPPMQWRMGKLQNSNLISNPGGGQPDVDQTPPIFPQIESQMPLIENENSTNDKSVHDSEDLNSQFEEKIISQPQIVIEKSENVLNSGPEIIRPISNSSLPLVDDEMPNGIRPMKIQRPRTPLIDAVAAHDKSKLRKVSERAIPPVPKEEEKDSLLEQMQLRKVSERAVPTIPKEEERDTLLEQIRAKSFNLKPAVQTRPSIQGPSTNLRVAAILEKANAIRQAFAGSDDDDDDDNDSWSDS